jgi:hypothetical protein
LEIVNLTARDGRRSFCDEIGGMELAPLHQPIRPASVVAADHSNPIGAAFAVTTYVACIAFALAHLGAGGLEAIAAAFLGMLWGAMSAFSNADRRSLPAKLEHILDTSFGAMWAGLMLAGLLHVPLHNFFETAFSAWR